MLLYKKQNDRFFQLRNRPCTGLDIRTDGIILLGSPIGSNAFVNDQIRKKVDLWINDISLLSNFVETHQSQVAFSVLDHGLLNRWTLGLVQFHMIYYLS